MSKTTNPEEPVFYTYVYLDPRKSGDFVYHRGVDEIYCFNYEPIYGGKGCDGRLDIHNYLALNTNKNKLFYNVIRKIYKEGLEPIIVKILQNVAEEEAFAEEINFISIVGRRDKGRGSLCNETDGGEGISGMSRIKDLSGLVFGRLIVINLVGYDKGKNSKWLCKCICGNEKIILGTKLNRGITKSCGCLQKEIVGNNRRTHGMKKHPLYNTWMGIIQRCINPNIKPYKDYGGRGIKVCDRWLKIDNFLEDMGERPTDKHKLGRLDIQKNYEPSNCKWVVGIANNAKHLIVDSEEKTITEWSKISGTKHKIIYERFFRYGWSAREAVYGKKKG